MNIALGTTAKHTRREHNLFGPLSRRALTESARQGGTGVAGLGQATQQAGWDGWQYHFDNQLLTRDAEGERCAILQRPGPREGPPMPPAGPSGSLLGYMACCSAMDGWNRRFPEIARQRDTSALGDASFVVERPDGRVWTFSDEVERASLRIYRRRSSCSIDAATSCFFTLFPCCGHRRSIRGEFFSGGVCSGPCGHLLRSETQRLTIRVRRGFRTDYWRRRLGWF